MPDMLYFDTEMRKHGVTPSCCGWNTRHGRVTKRWDTRTSAVATGVEKNATPLHATGGIVLAKSSLSTSVVLRFLLLIRTPERYAAWQSSWP